MVMGINLNGIIAIVGNYGSGKTETAINLALHKKKAGSDVRIADLDLVNPYFRTREALALLTENGIETILPDSRYRDADLPILSPKIYGMFQQPRDLEILDVGGGDVGSTVLGALAHITAGVPVNVLQVVNPHRQYSQTITACMKTRQEIEAVSGLKITGIVSNANLMTETSLDHIYDGYGFAQSLAEACGLPLAFITAPADRVKYLEPKRCPCPILPTTRRLVPVWDNSAPIKKEI